jgi:hypothetical protein
MSSISKVVPTATDQKLREEIANAISQPVTAKVLTMLTMTRLQAMLAKFRWSTRVQLFGSSVESFRTSSKDPLVLVQNFPKRVIWSRSTGCNPVYETFMVFVALFSWSFSFLTIKSTWTSHFTTGPMVRRHGSNSTPTPPPPQQDTPLCPFSALRQSCTLSSCSHTAQPTSSRSS